MKSILLTGNKIGHKGAESLAGALLCNKSLVSISLGGNIIGDKGAESIAGGLARWDCSLKTIYLDRNQISDNGAIKLACALKDNDSLERLELGGNKISFMGAESLEITLKENQALQVIGLDNNMIGDEGAGCFAAALMVNKTLQRVDLSSNNIGKGGAESLAESLRMNKTLLEIKLIGNNIGNDGTSILEMKSIFADVLEDNCTIQKVQLTKQVILQNHKKKAALPEMIQSLPRTSLELSLQVKTKTQDYKIAALEAELDSYKPEIVDLTADGTKRSNIDGNHTNPPSKRPRTENAARSVEALLCREI
mmetsp:Transcript_7374/g.16718  ORF Transcript_7374/g.16718 Transcript_7374/m.16718 type:complete len:308 (-) Transcript_7374:328-1251(-)|eukprot:CAMPEP_0172317076 /NCGR_PEP_ID=MMETSP1058-20130122/30486_1 /TAXON_ID=83371 /ORGANISM="Detonula confervacea, Strain CCMP 353" /LENGTH=307 /DNA_ID=CAMNT_0013031539 /DNA_START=205 /DNA_END=1128 /DNA_ORIENTATION=+